MLTAAGLTRSYPTPRGPVSVLSGVDLTLERGESAAITGPSGSGKSSLLYILGGLDPPTSGTVRLDGQDPYALAPAALAAFRNASIGFVFQDHCLLPQCTVLENVLVPTLVAGRSRSEAMTRARMLLDRVGLAHRLHHRPAELSGGEQQRVAIARALINAPTLVLCDEPTGNLDARSAAGVIDLLLELHQAERTILVIVTHSPDVASRTSRRYALSEGRLHEA